MNSEPQNIRLSYSLADQDFAATKSVGIYNLSTGLLKALAADARIARLSIFTNPSIAAVKALGEIAANPRFELKSYSAARSRLARIAWDQFGVYRAARKAGNEWLFLPKGYASFLRKPPVRLAAYVHDAMHDHYRRRHPGFVPVLEMAYFWHGFLASLRNSRLILTNSRFTAGELLRVCCAQGITAPAILPVGIGFLKPETIVRQKQDRIVVLASRWPHKLTGRALEYLDRWQRTAEYAGKVAWLGSMPEQSAFPSHSNWTRHARLPDAEYAELIDTSRALVYFSEYEGFGMPPVEALVRCVAPVYSDIPACTEVMTGCGWAFGNESYESFATALDSALKAPAVQLEALAKQLLQTHDWSRVSDRVLQALADH